MKLHQGVALKRSFFISGLRHYRRHISLLMLDRASSKSSIQLFGQAVLLLAKSLPERRSCTTGGVFSFCFIPLFLTVKTGLVMGCSTGLVVEKEISIVSFTLLIVYPSARRNVADQSFLALCPNNTMLSLLAFSPFHHIVL